MAVARNVRVKVRLSALEHEIALKGGIEIRPGRERTSKKVVVDSPVIEIPWLEYQQRKEDLNKVIYRGWQLIGDDPPECWIGEVTADPDNANLNFRGKVVSNNWPTTVSFEIDISPEFTTHQDVPANETPVQDIDPAQVTATFPAAIYQGWTFFVRIKANDGIKTVYSHVKSVEVPVLVV